MNRRGFRSLFPERVWWHSGLFGIASSRLIEKPKVLVGFADWKRVAVPMDRRLSIQNGRPKLFVLQMFTLERFQTIHRSRWAARGRAARTGGPPPVCPEIVVLYWPICAYFSVSWAQEFF